MADFLKEGFLTGTAGFTMALAAFEVSLAFKIPLDELGVPFAGAFEKKLCMVRCPDCGPELELCFFNEGGGLAGVASPSSLTFAILTAGSNTRVSNNRVGKGSRRVNWS